MQSTDGMLWYARLGRAASNTHCFGCAGSRTFFTQSTAMGDSREEYCDTTLLLSALHLLKMNRSDGRPTYTAHAPAVWACVLIASCYMLSRRTCLRPR